MKKFLKSNIKLFVGIIIGGIVFGSVGAYAAYSVFADNIGYTPSDSTWKKTNGEDITNVKDAIDDLYGKINSRRTVCMLISGTKETVGAKYVCDPGDVIARNFYVLSINGDNVKLIMDRNLSDTVGSNVTMTWNAAMNFFEEGNPGYATKRAWINVSSVGLPSAQDIANAGGIPNWNVNTATADNYSHFGVNSKTDTSKRANYAWLYNYTRGCSSRGCSSGANNYPDSNGYPYGYWTKNTQYNNTTIAWNVDRMGLLGIYGASDATHYGVRPVITVLKSNLAN